MPFGLFADNSWWLALAYVLVLGHLSNICVTLFLHRSMTHQGVRFHPIVEHAMRFNLWLQTGVKTREWVAIHRKHHAFADREGDPHSPEVEGLWAILLGGVFFYQREANDQETLEKYGKDCPNDWIERNLYTKLPWLGLVLMLGVDLLLFGWAKGLFVWTGMIIWLPLMGNIINGAGHALGYRNFGTKDESRNLYPWGIWILGEELHNNHHADPRSASFRARWYEFDVGWVYIKILSWFKLANIVYARALNAAEFQAKHYGRKASDAVNAASDAVSDAVASAKGAAEHAGGALAPQPVVERSE